MINLERFRQTGRAPLHPGTPPPLVLRQQLGLRGVRGSFTNMGIPNLDPATALSPTAAAAGILAMPAMPVAVMPSAGNLAAMISPAGSSSDIAALIAEQNADTQPINPIITLPPWEVIPASGQPFMYGNTGVVNLQAIGADQTIISFTVPHGKNGVIKWIANTFFGGGFQDGNGGLIWRLQADAAVLQGFSSVPWSVGSMVTPGPFGIRIFENQFIQLIVNNVFVAPSNQILGGMLRGWFYPLIEEVQSQWL
jgi:hypothetical protein